MGTSYHIKYNVGFFFNHQALTRDIKQTLRDINHSMSTFDGESEISVFNQMKDITKRLPISDHFFQVMTRAQKLHQITNGAWDGTVKPLVNLWGFGHTKNQPHKPDDIQIEQRLKQVGFQNISITDHHLQKSIPNLELNLASIAKGFGVDQVASVLEKHGIENFLVEIGGEVFARGTKINGRPWRVGINRPEIDADVHDVYFALSLENKAIATSGDYRNYFMDGKNRYSHVIDPKTGRPVSNGIVSVSVISDQCTFADGLATALMVMGHEAGIELVNGISGTECLMIQESDSGFKLFYSDHFPRQ
jgi:thiamine biosynthesis lipoprotein